MVVQLFIRIFKNTRYHKNAIMKFSLIIRLGMENTTLVIIFMFPLANLN